MGLFQKLIYGFDLDEEQAKQTELDRRLAEENKRDLDAGVWDKATFDIAEEHRRQTAINDVEEQVEKAFEIDNVSGTIGAAVSLPFKLVPWQLYAIGIVALLVYMGGLEKLAGILNKK